MVYLVKSAKELEDQLTEAGDKLVIVDFFAQWCGPCKYIAPKIEEMQAEYTDVVFLKVDVDECEDLAGQYEISSMPTFVLMKNKKRIDCFSGANAEKLKDLLKKHK